MTARKEGSLGPGNPGPAIREIQRPDPAYLAGKQPGRGPQELPRLLARRSFTYLISHAAKKERGTSMRRALRNILAVTAMTIPLAGTAPLAASAAIAGSPAAPRITASPVPRHDASGSPAASASPDSSFPPCTTGTSSGNVSTCIGVTGRGLLVQEIQTSATVINSARTIQNCLRGPDGTIGCTPFKSVRPGDSIGVIWVPDSDEPAGNYCSRTFRLNPDGTDTLIGQVCVDVHA